MQYKIQRTRSKRIKIVITQLGEVIVRTSPNTSLTAIDNFVNSQKDWIEKTISKMENKHPGIKKYEAKQGDKVCVFGNDYIIKFVDQGPSRIEGSELLLFVKGNDGLKALKDFYKDLTKTSILPQAGRMAYLLHFIGINFKVSSATTTWGTCKPSEENPTIRLNWRLALVPAYVADYVIVHELCHLYFPNHSKDFWNRVGVYMPDYKEREKKLKEYSWSVNVI